VLTLGLSVSCITCCTIHLFKKEKEKKKKKKKKRHDGANAV